MAEEKELEMEEGGKKKGKMMIIIIAVVVILAGGAAAFFLMGGSDDEEMPMEEGEMMEESMAADSGDDEGAAPGDAKLGDALYVAMPRPFVFNVPGSSRDRLVQIKVQLLVRGTDNEEKAKMHIPKIEGTLLRVFSSANADDLVTEAGKAALKDQALRDVQAALMEVADAKVVERVLFTGFVMQ